MFATEKNMFQPGCHIDRVDSKDDFPIVDKCEHMHLRSVKYKASANHFVAFVYVVYVIYTGGFVDKKKKLI